jgi:2-oxoglutarate dehydrogenase E2 component (dihydrolipoamide succinyltransferase)
MAVVDLVMPKLGESIVEATILKWHKKAGDKVQQDETVLDIATDKVDSEVPSTTEGTVQEVLFKENDVVPVGAVIARINTNGATDAAVANNGTPVQAVPAEPELKEEEPDFVPYTPVPNAPAESRSVATSSGVRFYSPLVLKIAQEEGISMSELEKMPGTGQDGRVSKKDILDYVAKKKSGKGQEAKSNEQESKSNEQEIKSNQQVVPAQAEAKPSFPAVQQSLSVANNPTPSYSGNVEIIEMDRMRKMIAKHMVDSKHTSPHVTSFTEADVTNMVLWREKVKKDFEKREGTKITFTPLFIEAIVKCIKKFPLINCSLDGDKIILKKDINIGMATALPSGNLIVPVIKGADGLNLVGLSKQVNNLADAARNGKLRPDDTQGGTFTMTNVGTFGSLMGTPIINQPQVAILAVGAIKKRPVVIETAQGDSIAIRHMMYLSMSYDHRIVDGSLGATFLTAVAKELEAWDISRSI